MTGFRSSLTEIAAKPYYRSSMQLPPALEQLIDRIIEKTEDISPEAQSAMREDLVLQFEALVYHAIKKQLDPENASRFDASLNESPDAEKAAHFLSQNVPDLAAIQQACINDIQETYLE